MPIVLLIGTEEDFRRNNGRRALTTIEVQGKLKLQNRALVALINKGEITPWEERLGNYQLFDEREVQALYEKRLKRY